MGLVLKLCEKTFGLKNFSLHEMFLVISRYRNRIVISTLEPDLLVYLCDLDVSGIWMNTLLNLFRINFSMFPLFHFL